MRHKTFELLEVKADGEEGQFTALASVFNNVDLVGDRMMPGAFSKTLANWRASGDPIPVVLSHQWDDPMAYVGKADPNNVVETEQGLVVNGTLDTSNPVGKQVYSLMKQRLIKGWSFGYTVPAGGEEFKDGANNVSEVDLIEVGPTLKGANPAAQLQAIKSLKQVGADPTVNGLQQVAMHLQALIDAEDDPEDISELQDILDRCQAMIGDEGMEGEKSITAANAAATVEVPGETTTTSNVPPPPRGEGVVSEESKGSVSEASDPLKDTIQRLWIDVHAGS